MRAVSVTLGERKLCLVFNGAAMFEAEETFGGTVEMLKESAKPGREGAKALFCAVALLSRQGEAVRRYMGENAETPITEEELMVAAEIGDILRLKNAVNMAVSAGYGREVKDEGDVDLGLVELQQKKKND